MRWWRVLRTSALIGMFAAGLALWVPGVSDTAAALAGAVVCAITLGVLYRHGRRANEEAATRLYYRLLDARFQEGLDYLEAGQAERALAFFDRVIEREPEVADAHFCRGLVHQQTERYRKAIADLERAIELNPGHPYAHSQRGFIYYQLEQYEQAVVDLTRAVEIRPDEWAYMLRGAALGKMGLREQAEADYERAARISPGRTHV
jgi:tetratricopeptide (TPR) repeat protein